ASGPRHLAPRAARTGRERPSELRRRVVRRLRHKGAGGDLRGVCRGNAPGRSVGPAQRIPRLLGLHARDPCRVLLPPLGVERDRLRRPGVPAGLHAVGTNERARAARAPGGDLGGSDTREGWLVMQRWLRDTLKGAVGPHANDSRYLLDVHRRDLPGQETMAHYDDADEVDLCIVGAGAGGSVLAQRLARRGWGVGVIEGRTLLHTATDPGS